MLGHDVFCVEYPVMNVVSELLRQQLKDDVERSSLVVIPQIAHIFENKRLWLMRPEEPNDFEEKRSLYLIGETVRPAQAVLF